MASSATTRPISSRSPSRATTVATRRRAACSASWLTRSVMSVKAEMTCSTSPVGPGSGSRRALNQRAPPSPEKEKSAARGSPRSNTELTPSCHRSASSLGSGASATVRPRKAAAGRPTARSKAELTNPILRSALTRASGSGESSTRARNAACPPVSRSSACLRIVMSLASNRTAPAPSGTRRRKSQRRPSLVGISSSRCRSSPVSRARRSSRSSGTTTSAGKPVSLGVRPTTASAGRPTMARAASLSRMCRSSPSSSISIGSSSGPGLLSSRPTRDRV